MENSNNTPDALDAEKMELIRRRRLEKLQSSTTSKPAGSSVPRATSLSAASIPPPAPQPTESNVKPNININTTNAPASQDATTQNYAAQHEVQEAASAPIAIPTAEIHAKRAREDPDAVMASPPPRKSTATPREESLEAAENRILSNVFRITLEDGKLDSSGHKLTFLPNLKQELEESGEPVQLSVGTLDSAILEAASQIPYDKPVLDYLLPCWKRINRALRTARGHTAARDAILKEAKRLCMSHCIFAATMPELFGREPNEATDSLTPYLLLDPEDDRGICNDFLIEAVSRFDEDDTVKTMLTKAFAGLSSRLSTLQRVNTEFFVRFVNLLLNDATYVLDEALTKFPRINDLQVALANPVNLTEEEKAAQEEELAQAEGQAQSYMQLANETMAMMKLFTAALSESFTMPEIVQRLADMLDYNLDTLVGPKSRYLKVRDPHKYYFNPKALLAEFIDIYLNLGKSQRFIEAVARDGRSYKPANFDHATRIMGRFSLKSKEELAAWQNLINQFKRAKEIDDQAEEDLGEIPDEFLDLLMFSLMEDPVILPMSKQTIDRSTIRSHLLSDPTDPFNRQPMSIEDVVPNVALKEQIRAFKEERKVIAKMAIIDKMDTTAG